MNRLCFLFIIVMLMFIPVNINAQQSLEHIINEFKSSIELPEYYNGKQLMTRVPYKVRNMHIENGILTFQYSLGNQSYTSCYSIEINLRKVEVKKGTGYNYNAWFAGQGNIVVRKTNNDSETILVDWFTFACKSEGMRDRIYNELKSIQESFKPQVKTNSIRKSSSNKEYKRNSQTHSTTKKSKSGKYVQ